MFLCNIKQNLVGTARLYKAEWAQQGELASEMPREGPLEDELRPYGSRQAGSWHTKKEERRTT